MYTLYNALTLRKSLQILLTKPSIEYALATIQSTCLLKLISSVKSTPRSLFSFILPRVTPPMEYTKRVGLRLRKKDITLHLPTFNDSELSWHHESSAFKSLCNDIQSPTDVTFLYTFKSSAYKEHLDDLKTLVTSLK